MVDQGELTPDVNSEWLHKRRTTVMVFALESLCLGMENSAFILTIWLYVTTMIDTSYEKLIYSLTAAAFRTSAILTSPLLGRMADKYRCTKKLFLIANALAVVGNLVYCIHFSPLCLILGRFIGGPAEGLRSVITSEVARSYDDTDLSRMLSMMSTAYVVGIVLGPALNSAFMKVDFVVYNLHINEANAPGLYMAIVFLIVQVVVIFFAHDLSKEFDMKDKKEKPRPSGNRASYGSVKFSKKVEDFQVLLPSPSLWTTLKKIFQSADMLMAFWFTFLCYYTIVTFDMWLPFMVLDVLQWSALQLNMITLANGVLAVILIFIVAMLKLKKSNLQKIMIIAFLGSIVTLPIFYAIKMHKTQPVAVILLWCAWVISFTVTCCADEVYLAVFVAMMTSSSKQAFVDSIRLGFARAGALIALLTSVYLFQWLLAFTIVVTILWFLSLLLFLFKLKSFKSEYQNIC